MKLVVNIFFGLNIRFILIFLFWGVYLSILKQGEKMAKFIIEYEDDIEEIRTDDRFELLPQIDKISKSVAYKLYLIEKNVIHVSVYLPDGVCFMSKVALRVKESDEIMTVVREFVSGIREEQKLQSIGFKVFTSIS
jgi:hypothetical protein